jgi:hypothetical protein
MSDEGPAVHTTCGNPSTRRAPGDFFSVSQGAVSPRRGAGKQ